MALGSKLGQMAWLQVEALATYQDGWGGATAPDTNMVTGCGLSPGFHVTFHTSTQTSA